jgi:hypothetical protein
VLQNFVPGRSATRYGDDRDSLLEFPALSTVMIRFTRRRRIDTDHRRIHPALNDPVNLLYSRWTFSIAGKLRQLDSKFGVRLAQRFIALGQMITYLSQRRLPRTSACDLPSIYLR